MPIAPQFREFSADVSVMRYLKSSASAIAADVLGHFQDSRVAIELETANAFAAKDTLNTTIMGSEYNVPFARGWNVDLGIPHVSGVSANPALNRIFGWELSTFDVTGVGGGDLMLLAESIDIAWSQQSADARIPRDTRPSADGGYSGWRYPRMLRRTWTIDLVGRVHAATGEFIENFWENAMQAEIYPATGLVNLPFTLTGPGITLSGNASISGGELSRGGEASQQTVRLTGYGPLVITTPGSTSDLLLLKAALSVNGGSAPWAAGMSQLDTMGLVQVAVGRPGGPTVGTSGAVVVGNAFITEARWRYEDGVQMQNGTLTGYGPLGLGAS